MNNQISKIIKNRIIESGDQYFANHNISKHIKDGEINLLIDEVAEKFQDVLDTLVIDTQNDHNTKDTARRVAKAWINEIFGGRYLPQPKITAFPNHLDYDQLYITGPITINSTCAHHFEAISGKAWIGVFPSENVIGLSKYNRICRWLTSRPTIQEELTVQIADEVEKLTKAKGVAVVIKASHSCMTRRGTCEHENDFTTSVVRGELRTSENLKSEFFRLLQGMKGYNG